MMNQLTHDRLVAKLQHFADMLNQTQLEKESLLLTIDRESCEKETLKTQIFLCRQISKEYYEMFEDILYR